MSDIPLLLGHRGARAFTSIPENSFASFDLAIEQGCDGFEFDVRLTGCGRALVCHNPKIGSVTVSRARANQLRDLPQSFIPDVVLELKTRSAAIPLGIICEKRAQLARWPGLPVEYVIAHESLVDEQLIADVRKAGRRLFTWTVNDRNGMLRAVKWGVEGIISDETELLVNTLRPKLD